MRRTGVAVSAAIQSSVDCEGGWWFSRGWERGGGGEEEEVLEEEGGGSVGLSGLAGDLHGLGAVLVVEHPRIVALQQAVEVLATAAAVHGGDAGGRGGSGARQTRQPSGRHVAHALDEVLEGLC